MCLDNYFLLELSLLGIRGVWDRNYFYPSRIEVFLSRHTLVCNYSPYRLLCMCSHIMCEKGLIMGIFSLITGVLGVIVLFILLFCLSLKLHDGFYYSEEGFAIGGILLYIFLV